MHGHGGDHDSPVRIELTVGLAQLALRYEDSAPPFDPLQYLRDAHPTWTRRSTSAAWAAWACRWWRRWSNASTMRTWTASTAWTWC